VAKTVRMGIAGLEAGNFRNDEGEEFAINVSIEKNEEEALEVFSKIYVTSLSGALVPLSQIARVELQTSPSVIRHFNKERFASVSAFVKTGYNTDALTDELIEKLNGLTLPEGYTFMAAGERESRQESFGGMQTIVIIALFGLLAILILEFRTFKSTLIVLSVIPLGIVGALTTLFLVGETLSFVATVGMIALVGIEIKNSIFLVDYTNQLREQGMPLEEAILEGAETRFLPIFLTTLTAIGGLIPLVVEDSPLISPLAWVIIGGLISSLLLSRIVTPLLYKLLPPRVVLDKNL
jgi:multidrug efflux pump subunit AcrB